MPRLIKAIKFATAIRWVILVLVLFEVWNHSHWSVALQLTVLTVVSDVQLVIAIRHLRVRDIKTNEPSPDLVTSRVERQM